MDYPRDDSPLEAARFWHEYGGKFAYRLRRGETFNVPVIPSAFSPPPPEDPFAPPVMKIVRFSMERWSDEWGERWYKVTANGETIEARRFQP